MANLKGREFEQKGFQRLGVKGDELKHSPHVQAFGVEGEIDIQRVVDNANKGEYSYMFESGKESNPFEKQSVETAPKVGVKAPSEGLDAMNESGTEKTRVVD